MIPIGARVRWAEKYQKNSPVIGVVTGHPQARMVEVDGKGAISVGLLEVVGEMMTEAQEDALNDKIEALMDERDAMAALVAEQCEAMASMVPGPDEDLQAKIDELQEWAANAASYLEDFLLVIYGERRPVRPIEPVELRRLADFVFDGG